MFFAIVRLVAFFDSTKVIDCDKAALFPAEIPSKSEPTFWTCLSDSHRGLCLSTRVNINLKYQPFIELIRPDFDVYKNQIGANF